MAPCGLRTGWGGERWEAALLRAGQARESALSSGMCKTGGSGGPGREGSVPGRDQLLCPGLSCSSTKTAVGWICVPEETEGDGFRGVSPSWIPWVAGRYQEWRLETGWYLQNLRHTESCVVGVLGFAGL